MLLDLIQKKKILRNLPTYSQNHIMLAGACSDDFSGPFHLFGSSMSSQISNLKSKVDF